MTAVPHVVLVGAMGAGKSTVGRLLADSLGRPLVDNDEELERLTGRTAAEIERAEGIDTLHRSEAVVLTTALHADHPAVITAAASVVEEAEVRAELRRCAFVVWLTADPVILARRTDGSTTRPRLDRDWLALAEHQRTEREQWFAAVADLTVSTHETPAAVLERIESHLSGGGAEASSR